MLHAIGTNSTSVMAVHSNSKIEPKNIDQQKELNKESKVEMLKKQIESGEYKINIEATAKSIAKTLI